MTARIYISQDLFSPGRINVYAEDVFIGYYEEKEILTGIEIHRDLPSKSIYKQGCFAKSISGKELNIEKCENWLATVKAFLAGTMPKEVKQKMIDNDQLNLF